jgi:glucokinase
VYIVGGIAVKISAALRNGKFMEAFLDNAMMRDYLQRIPVTLVQNPDVALLGARAMAIRLVNA